MPNVRVDMGDQAADGGDPIARTFDGMFSDFSEQWQPHPTLGRRGAEGMSDLSRIDQVYSKVSEFKAGRHYWSVAMLGSLHTDDHPSDYVPVLLRIAQRRSKTARWPRLSQELVRSGAYILRMPCEIDGGLGESQADLGAVRGCG